MSPVALEPGTAAAQEAMIASLESLSGATGPRCVGGYPQIVARQATGVNSPSGQQLTNTCACGLLSCRYQGNQAAPCPGGLYTGMWGRGGTPAAAGTVTSCGCYCKIPTFGWSSLGSTCTSSQSLSRSQFVGGTIPCLGWLNGVPIRYVGGLLPSQASLDVAYCNTLLVPCLNSRSWTSDGPLLPPVPLYARPRRCRW